MANWDNKIHRRIRTGIWIVLTLIGAVLGTLSLYFGKWFLLPVLIIIIINLYLFLVLFFAAAQGDAANHLNSSFNTESGDYLLPNRKGAMLGIPLLFIALIFSFAEIYYSDQLCDPHHANQKMAPTTFNRDFCGRTGAVYFSLVTFATVGYGDFTPVSEKEMWLVMWEITSGMLFLVCIVSLMISRISGFGAKSGLSVNEIEQIAEAVKTKLKKP